MTTKLVIISTEEDKQTLSIGAEAAILEIEELVKQKVTSNYGERDGLIEVTLLIPGNISSDKIKEIVDNNIPGATAWSKKILK